MQTIIDLYIIKYIIFPVLMLAILAFVTLVHLVERWIDHRNSYKYSDCPNWFGFWRWK